MDVNIILFFKYTIYIEKFQKDIFYGIVMG